MTTTVLCLRRLQHPRHAPMPEPLATARRLRPRSAGRPDGRGAGRRTGELIEEGHARPHHCASRSDRGRAQERPRGAAGDAREPCAARPRGRSCSAPTTSRRASPSPPMDDRASASRSWSAASGSIARARTGTAPALLLDRAAAGRRRSGLPGGDLRGRGGRSRGGSPRLYRRCRGAAGRGASSTPAQVIAPSPARRRAFRGRRPMPRFGRAAWPEALRPTMLDLREDERCSRASTRG